MRKSNIIRGLGIVFYGRLGLFKNQELLCDYHQLLVSLSPSKREESSKQL